MGNNPKRIGSAVDISAIEAVYSRNFKMIYRVCFTYMKNAHDTSDAVHDTFLRLISSGKCFESMEHEKAWLIRTAINVCKDALKHWRRKVENLDEHIEVAAQSDEYSEVFDVIYALPDKYRTVVLLYYCEGYSSLEISKILGRPQSTITNYMSEARKLLRKKLGGDFR